MKKVGHGNHSSWIAMGEWESKAGKERQDWPWMDEGEEGH